ncbi:MAG: hypothetical protein JWR37_692 [Mycobacterium sp.]|nr:hypothetical protein [Mycobacterium sp.]
MAGHRVWSGCDGGYQIGLRLFEVGALAVRAEGGWPVPINVRATSSSGQARLLPGDPQRAGAAYSVRPPLTANLVSER